MDAHDPQLTGSLAATAELFRRERPVLTVDEIDRIDRRLRAGGSRRPRRRRSSLAVAFCAALGLVFSTAGTGLAISGFASPGKAVHAQYAGPGQTGSQTRGGHGGGRASAKHSGATTLGDTARARQSADDRTEVFKAATRTGAPFTGFGAIPILVVGLAFFITGAVVNRRPRDQP
jgi:hypothetical protein